MILQCSELSKSFGTRRILEPLSLSVQKGEFLSILGPSGCGKTTLLRLIAGLEMSDTGILILDGQDIARVPANLRDVHTVFQKYALFPHMSVFENVAFGLRCQKLDTKTIQHKVEEALKLVGLEEFSNRNVLSLSGGEQQRVALVRALVNEPKLLLLDEPMGALDYQLKIQLQNDLVQIQKKTGTTFIYVTHDQQEALNMSDRIAVMQSGRIEQIGTPLEIYEFPQNEFVASFIGQIEKLDGRVEKNQDSYRFIAPLESSEFILPSQRDYEVSETARLCVRPEKIKISSRKPAQGPALEGLVKSQTYLGTHSQYQVQLKSGRYVQVFQQNIERLRKREIQLNDRVFLSWKPEHAHVFINEAK